MLESTPTTSFTITHQFDASVHRVWEAWTSAPELAQWFWGSLTHDGEAVVDLTVGGAYQVSVVASASKDAAGTRWAMRGLYLDIEQGRRLRYTVHWDAPVGYNEHGRSHPDEVVDVRFRARTGSGCEIEYVHAGIPGFGPAAVEHRKGTLDTFAALARVLASSAS